MKVGIKLKRLASRGETTLGALYIHDEWRCFTLEDEARKKKEYGETRIPSGFYQLGLRKAGRLHEKYSGRFGTMHKGMIHILDIPNFEWVYFHIGNDDGDTLGCPLVGMQAIPPDDHGRFKVYQSTDAYKDVYPDMVKVVDAGEILEIEDELKVNWQG